MCVANIILSLTNSLKNSLAVHITPVHAGNGDVLTEKEAN